MVIYLAIASRRFGFVMGEAQAFKEASVSVASLAEREMPDMLWEAVWHGIEATVANANGCDSLNFFLNGGDLDDTRLVGSYDRPFESLQAN